MRDFRNLEAWRKAHAFALDTYRLTDDFPVHERYGLTSQMRRAAMSVPTNVAEGSSRTSRRDYARFLEIAIGSASECEYQLILCNDLGYITAQGHSSASEAIIEVRRMLVSLKKRVLADSATGDS